MESEVLHFLLQYGLPAALAAGAVKATLNGAREDIREIRTTVEDTNNKVDRLADRVGDNRERLAALESTCLVQHGTRFPPHLRHDHDSL